MGTSTDTIQIQSNKKEDTESIKGNMGLIGRTQMILKSMDALHCCLYVLVI